MIVDKSLFWYQGLFLQPQHFQLSDLHQQHRLNILQTYAYPYCWGIARLQIREGALEQNSLEVSNLELLFEDGDWVSFPGNATLCSRSFEKDWPESEERFPVYIGLRKLNPEGDNVTVLDETAHFEPSTRFSATANPEEVTDYLGHGPQAHVKYLRYVLRLFWESELDKLGDYTVIPLLCLSKDGERISIDQKFIPPLLTISASQSLTDIVKNIFDQLCSRCRKLEEYKSPGGITSGELSFTSTIFLFALQTLNRYIPILHHLLQTPYIHPWQIYGVLRQLVGELSIFSQNISVLGDDSKGQQLIPDYDHKSPGIGFEAIRSVISRILDSLTAGPEFSGQFIFDDPYFTIEIPSQVFEPNYSYWIIFRTKNPEQAKKDILGVAKLSATKGMSSLLARAVSGIELIEVDPLPPGLPQTKDAVCLKINNLSRAWHDVEISGSLSLYWDTAPADMAAFLVVLGG
ncbi:type VI secretion system baseplate subunit TssK [Celerinatantimonas sp. MCCC 1A17872]|uniref:type VI secretion system baseplate subunit TssK n=1 Tax=Celerinatantimonas sp. MCCC 1A17872 TaxID=3177514 RepID=UPI0038C3D847